MPLTFYPQSDDAQRGTIEERIELLMDAAERYKAVILDTTKTESFERPTVPREITVAYNWEEIAHALREIREMSEGNKESKLKKAGLLTRLAEIYEVLRAAKMSKLEAVRLALISEAKQLGGGESQVA